MTAGARRITCHHCQSTALILTEATIETHTWTDGLYLVDGRIAPAGEAVREAGDIQPQLARIRCENCGHSWSPRRPVGMPYEDAR